MPSEKRTAAVEHAHHFIPAGPSEDRCICGAIRISYAEYKRREQVWADYSLAVEDSVAFKNYLRAKEAFQRNDLKTLGEVREENREIFGLEKDSTGALQVIRRESILPKPNFPNPATFSSYVLP